MKSFPGGGFRRLVLGLTVVGALIGAGLYLGLIQPAQAGVSALEGSTKSASSDVVYPGDLLTYTIVVSNTGPAITSTVFVTDVLPPVVTYVSHMAPAYVLSGTAGQVVTFTFPIGLGAEPSVSLEVVVRVGSEVAPGTVFTNTAAIDDRTTIVAPSA